MKAFIRVAPLVVIIMSFAMIAQAAMIDITRPGDPVAIVNGVNQGPDGDAGPPPAAEDIENAINDIGQKYLNFVDLFSGFSVTPSANPGNLPVTGLRLYTANDAVDRDPASFVLYGSNTGLEADDWIVIASGNLALPDGRNAGGEEVAIPPTGNAAAVQQEVLFEYNTDSFAHYQLIFPTLKNAQAANSMQIAEVEFLAVPEPASASMAVVAVLGLVSLLRRRR